MPNQKRRLSVRSAELIGLVIRRVNDSNSR